MSPVPAPTPKPRRRPRRSRSAVVTLGLVGRAVEELVPALVAHVLVRAGQGPRAGRTATAPRKALLKLVERAPLGWLSAADRRRLRREALAALEEELRIARLLGERRPLAWVAAHEGLEVERLREALRDPAVRRHYAWPEYSPVSGEIWFAAARFDRAAQHRLAAPPTEPAGRVLAPGWHPG